ncbi:glycosyl hydrolase family 18 protein [Streptomyces sp. NPDC020412]|uniref:glycosyl hydrolase family 18 protein n=1 Tax=Streptomyces sp. NPDC020412 TaxID=3365073 RepID=UPI0037905C92
MTRQQRRNGHDRRTGRPRTRHRWRGLLLAAALLAETGAVGAGAVGAGTAAAAPAPPERAAADAAALPVGKAVRIQNVHNGGQLGVTKASLSTWPVESAAPQGDDRHQSWQLEEVSGGHRLRNAELPSECLVRGPEPVADDCTGAGAVWDVRSVGGGGHWIGEPGTDRRLTSTKPISKSEKVADLTLDAIGTDPATWLFTPVDWPRQPQLPQDRRTLEHVTYLTAHNAMINTEDGYDTLAPNQPHSMKRQLADGVRALMPDVNKTVVGGRIPLCHGGGCGGVVTPSNTLDAMLKTVKEFLDANPGEIVSIFIEDQGSLKNDDYAKYGLDLVPGIRDLMFVPDDAVVADPALKQGWNVHVNGWPLLKDMVAKNKRLLIFSGQVASDNNRESIGFLADKRWRVENHWSMGLGLGNSDWACYSRWSERPLGTRPSGNFRPLFFMNHFRDVPMAPTYTTDNQKMKQRAEGVCTTAARRKPNFVAVDQYKDGDLFPQIQKMNEYWYQAQPGPGGDGQQPDPATPVGDPFDTAPDRRGPKPATGVPHAQCRPEGMAVTAGTNARYCDVYGDDGREWLGGNGTDRRVVGYFNATRNGTDGKPRYLVKNIPWTKVTHINYAFARVEGDRISVGNEQDANNPATGLTWPGVDGADMDPGLPYQGHFNQLAKYKKRHPQVKPLIAVGGWSDTKGFYAMTTNADGSVNRAGINTFADSVVSFLDRYGAAFDGVDIDYEYPTAMPDSGNPDDWALANPRRKGLQAGYNALMQTLREKLDRAGDARGRYYLLTSAASASGHLVRGYDAGAALAYQDFVNVMTYDLHGSWNQYVGPQAPLYDDGKDAELAAAGVYDDAKNPEYGKTGYFNVDWAYHYYRGALQPGRINLGVPYYTRGWRDVQGGTDGLWGTAPLPDQGQCQPGTGIGTGNGTPCGNGAVGIDNLWHDTSRGREVAAGSNPLWHARNLQNGTAPRYLGAYGLDPDQPPNKLTGTYQRKHSAALGASWLWNAEKKVFLTAEDEQTVDAKVRYVRDKGIGGVMMWELGGDLTRGPDGTYGMGHDLTTRISAGLSGAGGYGNERAGALKPPAQVLDVSVEFADYPTGEKDLWPQQPKLRITNKSGKPLPAGTELSFDIPTSAPPLLKDDNWQELKDAVKPGHTGANAGGLKGDFHRVTVKLGYCEGVPAGGARDIGLKYFLPVTGPANFTMKIGDATYGLTQDRRKGTQVVEPPAAGGGPACQAEAWDAARTYNPAWAPFQLWKVDGGWKVQDVNSALVLDRPGTWTTSHLVGSQDGNKNQVWNIAPDGATGRFTITSASGGRAQCLGADSRLAELSVKDCNGSTGQSWRFTDDKGAPVAGIPADGKPHGLLAANGHVLEPRNSAATAGSKLVAGDPSGATRTVVSYGGSYWRAKFWTKGNRPDAADPKNPWTRLGPVG